MIIDIVVSVWDSFVSWDLSRKVIVGLVWRELVEEFRRIFYRYLGDYV